MLFERGEYLPQIHHQVVEHPERNTGSHDITVKLHIPFFQPADKVFILEDGIKAAVIPFDMPEIIQVYGKVLVFLVSHLSEQSAHLLKQLHQAAVLFTVDEVFRDRSFQNHLRL